MKEASIEQFTRNAAAFLDAAQTERVVLLRDGRPIAVLVGIENKDREDIELEQSPEFWSLIENRRARPTMPLKEIETELLSSEE